MVALVILGIAVMIVTTSVSNSVPHLERVTNELRDQRILRNYALLKDSPEFFNVENLTAHKGELLRDNQSLVLVINDVSSGKWNVMLPVD